MDDEAPNRRIGDVVTHDRLEMVQAAIVSEFKAAVSELRSAFAISEQKILSELAQLKQTTEFADRQNAQNIAAASARITTLEGSIKDVARDLETEVKGIRKETADSRRLIYQTLIAPILVAVMLAVLAFALRGGFA